MLDVGKKRLSLNGFVWKYSIQKYGHNWWNTAFSDTPKWFSNILQEIRCYWRRLPFNMLLFQAPTSMEDANLIPAGGSACRLSNWRCWATLANAGTWTMVKECQLFRRFFLVLQSNIWPAGKSCNQMDQWKSSIHADFALPRLTTRVYLKLGQWNCEENMNTRCIWLCLVKSCYIHTYSRPIFVNAEILSMWHRIKIVPSGKWLEKHRTIYRWPSQLETSIYNHLYGISQLAMFECPTRSTQILSLLSHFAMLKLCLNARWRFCIQRFAPQWLLGFLFPQPNIHYNHALSSLTPDMLWWDFWLMFRLSIWK